MTIELDIVNRIVWSININKHSSLQIGNWLSDTRKTKKEKKKRKRSNERIDQSKKRFDWNELKENNNDF